MHPIESPLPSDRADAPPLRLILGITFALIVLYEIGLVTLMGSLHDARLAVGLAGPLFFGVPLVAALRSGRMPLITHLRLRPVSPAAVLAGALAVVAGVPAVLAVTARISSVPPEMEEFFRELLRASSPLEWFGVLAATAVAPALSEELLFRGWLQGGLERRIGGTAALVIAAVLFGLIHGFVRAPTAIALGLMLGWLTRRAGSVIPAIVAHVSVNAIAIAIANYELGDLVGDAERTAGAVAGAGTVPWSVALGSALLSGGGFFVFDRACRRAPSADGAPEVPE